jgi:hypothetical protein
MKSTRHSTLQSAAATVAGRNPTHEDISAAAQLLWIEKGRPEGQDDEIWLEAERRLRLGLPAQRRATEDSWGGGNVGNTETAMAELDNLYPSSDDRATTSL